MAFADNSIDCMVVVGVFEFIDDLDSACLSEELLTEQFDATASDPSIMVNHALIAPSQIDPILSRAYRKAPIDAD